MSKIEMSDYSELVDEGGFTVKTPVAPEDEFFHAVYISGQQRQNHLGETEMPGKLQIRGLKSNLDVINMIVLHVKTVLVRTTRTKDNRDHLDCFSYQAGSLPWKGTTGRICGKNATERAANEYCAPCRSQLIITGLYLDENGHPFKINNKEQYIFIRAKGVKYGNLANYLSDLAKRDDLEPIVTPVTEQSKNFEKAQVNNKRFITKISVGKQSTNYGLKDVFEFSVGQKLGVEAVKSVLNKAKETIEKFRDKFDWSKGKSGSADYSGTKPVEESQKFEFSQETKQNAPGTTEIKEQKAEEKEFNFEDVSF
jgi:hypothetical protein